MSDEAGSDSSLSLSISPMDTSAVVAAAAAAAALADADAADDAAAAAAATAAALHALDEEEPPMPRPMPLMQPPRLRNNGQTAGVQSLLEMNTDSSQVLTLDNDEDLIEEADDVDAANADQAGQSTKRKRPVNQRAVPSLMDLIVTPSGARKRPPVAMTMGMGMPRMHHHPGGIRPLLGETGDAASAYRPVAKKQCGAAGLTRSTADSEPHQAAEAKSTAEIPSLLELDCGGGVGAGRATGQSGIPSLLDFLNVAEDDSQYHSWPVEQYDQEGYGGECDYYDYDYYGGYGQYQQQHYGAQQQPTPLLWGSGGFTYVSGLLNYSQQDGRTNYQQQRGKNAGGGTGASNSADTSKVPSLMPTGPPSLLDFM